MAFNVSFYSCDGSNPVYEPCGNIRPPEQKQEDIVPHQAQDGEYLFNEHIKFKHLTEMSLTQGETRLFGELKRILTMIADNKIPEDDDKLRAELKTLKKIDGLIKKKREIPIEILEVYRSRRNEIENNLKTYVKRKFGGYDDKIDLPSDQKPKEGIAYICKKAKLALIFV